MRTISLYTQTYRSLFFNNSRNFLYFLEFLLINLYRVLLYWFNNNFTTNNENKKNIFLSIKQATFLVCVFKYSNMQHVVVVVKKVMNKNCNFHSWLQKKKKNKPIFLSLLIFVLSGNSVLNNNINWTNYRFIEDIE